MYSTSCLLIWKETFAFLLLLWPVGCSSGSARRKWGLWLKDEFLSKVCTVLVDVESRVESSRVDSGGRSATWLVLSAASCCYHKTWVLCYERKVNCFVSKFVVAVRGGLMYNTRHVQIAQTTHAASTICILIHFRIIVKFSLVLYSLSFSMHTYLLNGSQNMKGGRPVNLTPSSSMTSVCSIHVQTKGGGGTVIDYSHSMKA